MDFVGKIITNTYEEKERTPVHNPKGHQGIKISYDVDVFPRAVLVRSRFLL